MAPVGNIIQAIHSRLTRGERPLRFILAGGINTIFGLSVYPLLLWLIPYFRREYLVALLIAQGLSLCFAFLVYKFTVFRTRNGALGEFGRFVPFYLFNYAINFAMLPILVRGAGIPPVIAQLLFSVALMIGSYFWHSHITFSSNGNKVQ